MSSRHRSTRRTVLRTIGSLSIATVATSAAASARGDSDDTIPANDSPSTPLDTTRYVAVVDRIVDGRHVVLLLERDGDLVDQHVAPRSKLEDVDEGAILQVVLQDDELLTAQQLSKRPGRSATDESPRDRLDDLVSSTEAT
ncbi:DUF3006 domain-containing protein [Natronolimnohabitans sp. A-GB9]|uniref:DUF3006 domain-containing protein n=1 Tax=Natronolimnohabitans sp. A-GB9 TaxID=3069757 RepID=UPI0027B06A78|nr:DUF3006 domain-containing protein [Natronolimnohabitans sp. A-GB9]MDQ2052436.1 DUF3006 domain-containing protein [Natronolimnohabitans sp. A-GB9]